jgi:Holliday junction resolvase
MEAKLQSKIIKWLKAQGFYVIKTKPQPGTPVGCPDIIFLHDSKWGCIEVKASEKAPFRQGQQATLQHLKKGNRFVYVAHPESWPSVQQEIVATFL